MNYEDLLKVAQQHSTAYLQKEKLGHDEELQLLSCAYSILFLSACAQKSLGDLAKAHQLVAHCHEKIGNQDLAERHLKTADAYLTHEV